MVWCWVPYSPALHSFSLPSLFSYFFPNLGYSFIPSFWLVRVDVSYTIYLSCPMKLVALFGSIIHVSKRCRNLYRYPHAKVTDLVVIFSYASARPYLEHMGSMWVESADTHKWDLLRLKLSWRRNRLLVERGHRVFPIPEVNWFGKVLSNWKSKIKNVYRRRGHGTDLVSEKGLARGYETSCLGLYLVVGKHLPHQPMCTGGSWKSFLLPSFLSVNPL